jgi:putative ABC transport system ATP-binding protein
MPFNAALLRKKKRNDQIGGRYMTPYVVFDNVAKVYDTEGVKVNALHDVSFEIGQGEVCVIVGQSGAGKTTLLNILGGMDTLTSGSVFLGGDNVSAYNRRQLTRYRREDVGFVFQFYNLIPNLTALENVEMATELAKAPFSAEQVLNDVGLSERMMNFPAQLSGGEQQRVAIARALAKNPKLLLCDEPTGALDDTTGKQVLKILQDLSREKGMTVVIITHNSAITEMADRVVKVKSGTVSSVRINEHAKPIEEIEW